MVTRQKVSRPYTQALLYAAYQATARELVDALATAGHADVRHKHGAVFANLNREGTRASVLAERAGIGRAAMGELVDELERLGHVERRPDPADRRAKLVRPTERGLAVIDVVHRVNRAIERRLAEGLGEEGYAALRRALETIVPDAPAQPRIAPRPGGGRRRHPSPPGG